jgi:alkylhydroperoxidase/carboxymuconolactone decarboxylase family protein YurZ
MMLDRNEYYKQLLATIAAIGQINPEIVRGYPTLGDAGNKTNKLDPKVRALIAVAPSLHTTDIQKRP